MLPTPTLAPIPYPSTSTRLQLRWGEVGLWLALFAVLLINLPAFVCRGLDPDPEQWDLGARIVLQGSVAYRDWLENNLPGMLWLHMLIRSALGWRSEVLRLVDVLVVLTLIAQLTRWLPAAATRNMRLVLAGGMLIFYLSTSEWCHCQRDVWMLVPALAALSLRLRQVRSAGFVTAFVEGTLWGVAFWIKPFVIVPALLCWLLSARLVWQAGTPGWRLVLNGVAVIAGGMACGAAGTTWLMATGAWPTFAEILFVWNREYFVIDETNGHRLIGLAGFLVRFFPWVLVHLFAVPEACYQIGTSVRRDERSQESQATALLAMLYLGWLFQASCLQHFHDYVQVPCFFLAMTVVGYRYAVSHHPVTRRTLLALLLICVLARFPLFCAERLLLWNRCLHEGSTAALRDRMMFFPKTSWADLEEVQAFLRCQDIQDGELTCTDMGSLAVYQQLDIKPATRFPFLKNMLLSFTRRHSTIFGELAASRQRFLLCDIQGYGMDKVRRAVADSSIPYAWSDHIVFRSGRYVVFRLSGAETQGWVDDSFTP